MAAPAQHRSRQPNVGLTGRIVKLKKNYIIVHVSRKKAKASLHVDMLRRIMGCEVKHMQKVFQDEDRDAAVIVSICPMTIDRLRKAGIDDLATCKTIKKNIPWDIRYFGKNTGRRFQPPTENLADYATDQRTGDSRVPARYVGRFVAALRQILRIWNAVDLQLLIPLFKTQYRIKTKDVDATDYIPDEDTLRVFIRSQSRFFGLRDDIVKLWCGFDLENFKEEIRRRLASSNFARSLQPPACDVTGRTRVIESCRQMTRVLNPVLDAHRDEIVVALDCEGVKLGHADGELTIVQVATMDGKAFIFDVFKSPDLLQEGSALRDLLESEDIVKVIHDCRSDAYSLFKDFGVQLKNVFDTSVAMRVIMEQYNLDEIRRVGCKMLCEMLGQEVDHKDAEFNKKMIETPEFWKIRPLDEEMTHYAASDVLCLLPGIYRKVDSLINPGWREYFTWSCKQTLKSKQQYRRIESSDDEY